MPSSTPAWPARRRRKLHVDSKATMVATAVRSSAPSSLRNHARRSARLSTAARAPRAPVWRGSRRSPRAPADVPGASRRPPLLWRDGHAGRPAPLPAGNTGAQLCPRRAPDPAPADAPSSARPAAARRAAASRRAQPTAARREGRHSVDGAEHRADALGGQLEHLHVRRPGRFGVPQRGVQPGLRGSSSPSLADSCRRSSGRSRLSRSSRGMNQRASRLPGQPSTNGASAVWRCSSAQVLRRRSKASLAASRSRAPASVSFTPRPS